MANVFETPLLYEKSKKGRRGYRLPSCDVPSAPFPEKFRRNKLLLPEVSELDVVRHFTTLSQKNFAVDTGFYPLGSCTMKYNPKVNEDAAGYEGFLGVHPLQPEDTAQGALQVMWELSQMLSILTGMDAFTLQPAAGAHGELTGLLMIQAYFNKRKEERDTVLIPDSAHGTNPATAAMLGFNVVEVKSDSRGGVDLSDIKEKLSPRIAALMLTNPNTLGIFDENILEVASLVHKSGALLYYDGANFNASMGIVRPGDMGFDVIHLNLHKTFSVPHGGGGPGSGPVGVKSALREFLPAPILNCQTSSEAGKEKSVFGLDWNRPCSIGKIKSFYGNFLALLRAYCYLRYHGGEGVKKVAQIAVLNANYLMNNLKGYYDLPYDRTCQHEFVLSARRQKAKGVKALDIAKRLLDFGIHSPTIYFPLIVEEALMIEPTETESKETLDHFIKVMVNIAKEAEESQELLREAPKLTHVRRLDEVSAARKPNLCCRPFN